MNSESKHHMQKLVMFVGGALTAGLILYHPSSVDGAKAFNYKGKTVISTLEESRMDQIYVSLPQSQSSFTNLSAYLRNITNQQERLEEESAIRNLIK